MGNGSSPHQVLGRVDDSLRCGQLLVRHPALIAGNDIPISNTLQLVFDGQLGARTPGAETVDAALQIHYTAPGGDELLVYTYL